MTSVLKRISPTGYFLILILIVMAVFLATSLSYDVLKVKLMPSIMSGLGLVFASARDSAAAACARWLAIGIYVHSAFSKFDAAFLESHGQMLLDGLLSPLSLDARFWSAESRHRAAMMFPLGGKQRILGNNPLAYAFPAAQCLPVVLDFSLSVVSSGKLILCRKKGEKIPLGWAVDKEGVPTEDPFEGYEGGGSLAPVGGHKGYGLVLAHEMLTALLTGGKWTREIKSLYEEDPSRIQGTCHSFMAIDPDCFIGREEFKKNMDLYIQAIKGSARARGTEEILLPGEPEHRTEVRFLQEGIPLPPNTVKELIALAETLGISPSCFQQV
jgi:hypothetical protein